MFGKLRKLAKRGKNGNGKSTIKSNDSKHRVNGKANGNSLGRIRGYLTRDDLNRLEEASKRVLKYPKQYVPKYKCGSCNYEWLYTALKCPVCSAPEITKVG